MTLVIPEVIHCEIGLIFTHLYAIQTYTYSYIYALNGMYDHFLE